MIDPFDEKQQIIEDLEFENATDPFAEAEVKIPTSFQKPEENKSSITQHALFSDEDFEKQNKNNSIDRIGLNAVEDYIIKERNYYYFTQLPSTKCPKLSYAEFLLIKLMGRTSYLTRSQALRYLDARKRFYDSQIEFNERIFKDLRSRGIISPTSEVEIKKGKNKGSKISPHYLTAQGYKVLCVIDKEWSGFARFGVPNEKLIEKMLHEVLITEVFVKLTEEGHFVYWLVQEEELRREKSDKLTKHILSGSTKALASGMGDFRICYYDKNQKSRKYTDGEVAIRYPIDRIIAKGKELDWFCIDKREAEKIYHYLRVKPTILDTGSIGNDKSRFALARKGKFKLDEDAFKWVAALGGITVETLAILCDVHYLTARSFLKSKANLMDSYQHLQVARSRGRGIKFYQNKPEYLNGKTGSAFTKSLAIQSLNAEGKSFCVENGEFIVCDVKNNKRFLLVGNGDFVDNSYDYNPVNNEIESKITEANRRNLELIIAVRDINLKQHYEKIFPNSRILDVRDYQRALKKHNNSEN